MLVKGDRDHGRSRVADESVALLIVGELQKLLTEVVAKGVSHELDDVGSSLVEYDLEVLCVALLKLLLQEAAAVLILAEAVDLVTRHSLQIVVHEAVGIVLHAAALDDTSLAVLDAAVGSVCGVRVVVLLSTRVHAVGSVRGRSTVLRSKGHTVHSTVEHIHAVSVVWGTSGSARVLRYGRRANSTVEGTVAWSCGGNSRTERCGACMKT